MLLEVVKRNFLFHQKLIAKEKDLKGEDQEVKDQCKSANLEFLTLIYHQFIEAILQFLLEKKCLHKNKSKN